MSSMTDTAPLRTGLLTATALLAACGQIQMPDVSRLVGPQGEIVTRGEGPPDARPDACYGQHVTPAEVETVTEQVMLQPPQIDSAGHVLEPAIFMTETRHQIVRERQELWFETPCAATDDPEFIAALQRALAARGYYTGAVNGEMTARTRRAIRDFQRPLGLDSSVLSLAAARILGLAIWNPQAAGVGPEIEPVSDI